MCECCLHTAGKSRCSGISSNGHFDRDSRQQVGPFIATQSFQLKGKKEPPDYWLSGQTINRWMRVRAKGFLSSVFAISHSHPKRIGNAIKREERERDQKAEAINVAGAKAVSSFLHHCTQQAIPHSLLVILSFRW